MPAALTHSGSQTPTTPVWGKQSQPQPQPPSLSLLVGEVATVTAPNEGGPGTWHGAALSITVHFRSHAQLSSGSFSG